MPSHPTESSPEKSGTVALPCGSDPEFPLVVDRPFQFSILNRVCVYGGIGAFYAVAISLASDTMADPLANWRSVLTQCLDETVYVVPGLLVIVPLVTVNLLRLTRRYASPVNKLSNGMHLLSEGKSESPLVFDENDAWVHLATQFNELREEILELRQAVLLQSAVPPASPTATDSDSLPEIEIPDLSKELNDAMLSAQSLSV